MSIGIYKIENLINHKKYIGQSINIEKRWQQHLSSNIYANPFTQKYNYPLYRAFRKYGINNFSFSIIELCDQNKLNEQEIFWIKNFDSYNNGYNQTLGGNGTLKILPPVYQYDIFGNFIKEYKDIHEAAYKNNLKETNIYGSLSGVKKLSGNYQWSYIKTNKIEHAFSSIPVLAFTFEGEKKYFFESMIKASQETGDCIKSIKKSCETKHHSGKHFQWRYWFENPDLKKIEPYKWSPKEVIDQYDLDGNYIDTFESITFAAKSLNLSTSNLVNCCQKKQKSCGGFQWCYHNEEPPSIYKDDKIGRKTNCYKKIVQQFSKENDFIEEYESAHEAARQIGYPQSANHITECCQKKRKTCRNFIWRYKDE